MLKTKKKNEYVKLLTGAVIRNVDIFAAISLPVTAIAA